MNVKDIIELEIESNGMNGEGVARFDGRVVFVPYTLRGEKVRAEVRSVKSRYAQARVIKVLTPSPLRVKPDCPYYFKCGGCDMRHIAPEARREILLAELKSNLKKIAEIDYTPVDFISLCGKGGARNKLSMPFGLKDGKVVLGLYRQNTHVVEPVDCIMASEAFRMAARKVVEFADREKLSVYDEKSGKGLLRHLVMREAGGRVQATLVINGDGLGKAEEKSLAALLGDIDLFVCPNTRRSNVIMGDTVRLVSSDPRLKVDVLGVKAELSPLSFFQVNDGIRDELYKAAIGEISAPTMIDLYSGIGITSNLAAKKCDKVFAVECVPQAVADANETARINGNSDKIENIFGKAEIVLPQIVEHANNADVLVDPPRKGCGASVMTALAEATPEKLIYISCNHATMCRDIKLFIDGASERGETYRLKYAKLFDMFEYTHHVETLCILSKG